MDSVSILMIILELLGTAAAAATLVIVIWHCHIQKMKYLVAFSICNFIYSLVQTYGITAHGSDTVVILFKIALLVIPLMTVFGFFFALDYSGRKLPEKWIIAVMFIISFGFSLLGQFYPAIKLIYKNIEIVLTPGQMTVSVFEAGPLFTIGSIIIFALLSYSSVIVIQTVAKTREKRNLYFMLGGTLLVLSALVLSFIGVMRGWDPFAAVLSIMIFIWSLNTVRYRTQDWVAFSRDSAIQKMSDGYLLIGNDGKLIDINSGAYDYFPQLHKAQIGDNLQKLGLIPDEVFDGETQMIQYIAQNGELYYYTINRTPVHSRGHELATSILIINSTDNYKLIDHLKELSRRDPLTKLYNRAAFFNDVAGGIDTILRRGADGAAMMLDIDFFKSVNDEYGHTAGDTVLQGIADLLRLRLRGGDIVARYGGEEFCIWLPNTSLHGAMLVAESIRKSVEEHTFSLSGGLAVNVTISIGVALTIQGQRETLEGLLTRADDNLYRAKNSGRNKVAGPEAE